MKRGRRHPEVGGTGILPVKRDTHASTRATHRPRGEHSCWVFPFFIVRRPLSVVRFALVILVAMALCGCDQMYDQVTVRPGEGPQMLPSSGTVAATVTLPATKAEAISLTNPLLKDPAAVTSGTLAYRRYCWPCHGPDHDGQSATVGPSFPRGNLNLLDPEIVAKSDGEYFWHITNGNELAPPFAGAMTVDERWQVISYLRHVQAQKKK